MGEGHWAGLPTGSGRRTRWPVGGEAEALPLAGDSLSWAFALERWFPCTVFP